MEYDLVLAGGRVIDTSQALDGVADVAFSSGKVAAVGSAVSGIARWVLACSIATPDHGPRRSGNPCETVSNVTPTGCGTVFSLSPWRSCFRPGALGTDGKSTRSGSLGPGQISPL
jgi:hypothetical protein